MTPSVDHHILLSTDGYYLAAVHKPASIQILRDIQLDIVAAIDMRSDIIPVCHLMNVGSVQGAGVKKQS